MIERNTVSEVQYREVKLVGALVFTMVAVFASTMSLLNTFHLA